MDLFYKSRPDYIEKFKQKLEEISEFLGDHPYLAGNHVILKMIKLCNKSRFF